MSGDGLDLEALREVAQAATPGPWRWELPSKESWPQSDESLVSDGVLWEGSRGDKYPTSVLSGWGYDASGTEAKDVDRAHIAAFDPPTVLALLDALTAAERERDEARAVVERVKALAEHGERVAQDGYTSEARHFGRTWAKMIRAALDATTARDA